MPEHTELPWSKTWDDEGFFYINEPSLFIMGCPGDIAEANADFIVLAVNHHAQLIAALQSLATWAELVNDASNEGGLLGEEYDKAKELLRKLGA